MGLWQTLTLLFSTVVAVPHFPNIEYLGRGYNIIFGNPDSTEADLGWQVDLFSLSYANSNITPDGRYMVPYGVDAFPSLNCWLKSKVDFIAGTFSYSQSVSEDVSADFSAWNFAFSGSADYNEVEEETKRYSRLFSSTKAECEVYQAFLRKFDPPALTKDFKNGVAQLPVNMDLETYVAFIQYFGTHYTQSLAMGARFSVLFEHTSDAWSRMVSSNFDVEIAASFANLYCSAAASAMTKEQTTLATTFIEYTTGHLIITNGPPPPVNATVNAWAAEVILDPFPMHLGLQQISELLTSQYFPNDPNIAKKKQNLKVALAKYCHTLINSTIVTCFPPPPDPPFPSSSIFAGIYQTDDCGVDNVVNPYTNSLSCTADSKPYAIGRVKAPESQCGAWQYVCLRTVAATDPELMYGGNYEPGDQDKIPNPLTKGMTCPEGYSSVQTGAVQTAEPTWGYAPQYGCFNLSSVLGEATVGGMYQVPDLATNNGRIFNVFTNACSCPPGFTAYPYGRVLVVGVECGAVQFVCLNNVYSDKSSSVPIN